MSLKDFNDCLKAGVDIASIKSTPIDLYSLNQKLNKVDNRDAEWMVAESFVRTVQSQMVKSEIAKYLSDRWGEKLDEIRDWIKVSDKENVADILGEFASVDDCLKDLLNASNEQEYGVGFPGVDASVKLRKKDVYLVGAYSFAGKSDLLIEHILHWILREKLRVLVFSLEMPKKEFMERIVYKIIGTNSWNFKKNTNQQEVAAEIKTKLEKYLQIIDTNGLTMDDIEKRIRVANTHVFDDSVDVVCVDYFGYIKGTDNFESASIAARRMKEIAKKYNIIFVMLSQFARTSQYSEKGKTREPMLYDLKSTGDLEASGDLIILLWRPVLNTPNLSEIDREAQKYLSYIKIAKSRRGIRGDQYFELAYDPNTSRLKQRC